MKQDQLLSAILPEVLIDNFDIDLFEEGDTRFDIWLDEKKEQLSEDIADRFTDVSKAYRRGKAASKVKLHSREMMLAQVGSPLYVPMIIFSSL